MNDRIMKFFPCACHGEGMTVSYWPEDKMFSLTIYRCGVTNIPIWDRVKFCARVLWTGRIVWDDILLGKHIAKKIAREILKLANRGVPGDQDETKGN